MADSFGYKPQRLGYGYQQPSKSPNSLTLAASKRAPVGPFFTDTTSSAQTQAKSPFTQPSARTVVPSTSSPGVAPTTANVGAINPTIGTGGGGAPGVAYDINTDPALQQAQSFLGMNDAQANAQALKQKQQEVLAYGDPTVAAALFGANDPFVQAAGQNPTSTLKQLGQQRERGLADMTENYNKQNLAYSGARVKGEQQFGQDYQSALAEAASGFNQRLGGIDSQLAQALGQSNYGRIGAMQDAYGRHQDDPGVDPVAAAAATDPYADPNQRNRPGIVAGTGPSDSGLDAILAALGAGPSAVNRTYRWAG